MKNFYKYLTILIMPFILMIGINVKAFEVNYIIDSYGEDRIQIVIPIHKTDENKNALEGAEFTLKDFNDKVSYTSTDKGDGDYLIEVNKSSSYTPVYHQYRIIDNTGYDEVFTEILDIIPSKYSDVIRKAKTKKDLYKMIDLPSFSYTNYDGYSVGFYVPLKIEETKVPVGYKAKSIVVPSFVMLRFSDYSGHGNLMANLMFGPSRKMPYMVPGYFEYDESIDYEALFDKINNNLSSIDNYDAFFKLFEDNGAIVDKACVTPTRPEDIEDIFDEELTDYLCPINLVDEKEEVKKQILVNPATAGTVGVVTILLVISSFAILYTRKVKNN